MQWVLTCLVSTRQWAFDEAVPALTVGDEMWREDVADAVCCDFVSTRCLLSSANETETVRWVEDVEDVEDGMGERGWYGLRLHEDRRRNNVG